MASNKVLSSKNVAMIFKGGQEVPLAEATETALWKRPEIAVNAYAGKGCKAHRYESYRRGPIDNECILQLSESDAGEPAEEIPCYAKATLRSSAFCDVLWCKSFRVYSS
jgi:hypothetical protein